ncbi:rhomboid family intramembrane serine protease [Planctobacterium marinum]|uniref:rhomboid family intramembrane serine protease n=1 Tax=Planctobacterium marinum TaxID=1631968 RepID=UPI001E308A46|nr:rhomboid family intramembrane serine protease [Planctobacterium marinum]MCC2604302.1 rhomboid family intramembrane serine protease [Planctobacterium marinum]
MSSVKPGALVSIKQAAIPGLLFVVSLWCIKIAEVTLGVSLHELGVYPGKLAGLVGIVTGPLVHGSFEHLASNSLPLLLLLGALYFGYPNSKYWTIAIVWIGSGLGTWVFAREAWHFGASGLTHGLFFYLLLASILRRDKRSIALMMIAFFMYGSMTLTIFPREQGVSFEYHLFGAVAGLVAAVFFRRADPKPVEPLYPWEEQDQEDEVIGDEWQLPEQQNSPTPDSQISNNTNKDNNLL